MLKSRRAAASMLQFLIGLILAVMVIFFFSRLIYSCLKTGVQSEESFQKLADEIERLSTSSQTRAEPVFINLDKKEFLLFFDNGTQNMVLFIRHENSFDYSDFDKGPFLFSDEDYSYDYFLEKSDSVLVFKKPKECGNQSCTVLCRDAKIARLPVLEFKLQKDDVKKISSPDKKLFMLACGNTFIRNTKAVAKYHRKPFYIMPPSKITRTAAKIRRALPSSNKIPVILLQEYFEISDYIPLEDAIEKYPASEIKGYSVALISGAFLQGGNFYIPKMKDGTYKLVFSNDPLYLSEAKEEGWTDLFWPIKQTYVQLHPYGDDMMICYMHPCITLIEEVFINWEKNIDVCLESPKDCVGLSATIKNEAEKDKILLKRDNNVQVLVLGEQEFPLDKDIDMALLFEKDDGTEETIAVTELSLEYDYDAAVNKVRLEAGGKKYSFTGMSSDKEGGKPRLKFLVRQYKEAS